MLPEAPFDETTELAIEGEDLVPILSTWTRLYWEECKRAQPVSRAKPKGWFGYNFEMVGPMVAMMSLDDVHAMTIPLEQRLVRSKLPGKKPWGAFTMQDIAPGHFIAPFAGALKIASSLEVPSENNSHLLFLKMPPHLIQHDLVIDARLSGSKAMRSIRRSCRANCEIKLILLCDGQVQVGLFAKQAIWAGDELCLPLGFDQSPLSIPIDGSRYPSFICGCGQADLCLGPPQVIPPVISTAAAISSGMAPPKRPRQASAPATLTSPTANTSASDAILAAAAAEGRKLTREERKMLQYIEYFERMESAEANKRKRSHSTHQSVVTGQEDSSGRTSPKVAKAGKRAESPLSPQQSSSPSTTRNNSPIPSSPLSPAAASGSGVIKSSSPRRTMFRPASSDDPDLATAPKHKHDFEDDDRKKKKQRKSKVKELEQHDSVDVRAPTPIDVEGILSSGLTTEPPYSSRATPLSQTIPDASAVDLQSPGTPSRKKVSLTDYLKKKRSTPQQSKREEEGEERDQQQEPKTYEKVEQQYGQDGIDYEEGLERQARKEHDQLVRVKPERMDYDQQVRVKPERMEYDQQMIDGMRTMEGQEVRVKEERRESTEHNERDPPLDVKDSWDEEEEAEQGEITTVDHRYYYEQRRQEQRRQEQSRQEQRRDPFEHSYHHEQLEQRREYLPEQRRDYPPPPPPPHHHYQQQRPYPHRYEHHGYHGHSYYQQQSHQQNPSQSYQQNPPYHDQRSQRDYYGSGHYQHHRHHHHDRRPPHPHDQPPPPWEHRDYHPPPRDQQHRYRRR